MTSIRIRIVCLLAATLMVFAAACQPEISKEVLFVTDSVTQQSGEEIIKEFALVSTNDGGRYAPNFGSAVGGQGLTNISGVDLADVDVFWAQHMDSLVEHTKPEVLLVELGYNDCKNLSGYASRIDNFMAHTAGVPTYWLTLADQNSGWQGGNCDDVVNAELVAAVSRWDNLSLLPYREWALANPANFADAVHLNATGQTRYADWLKAQLDGMG